MTQVFLSYAHVDNQTLHKNARGWVSFFFDALKIELGQSGYANKISIWWDIEEKNAGRLADKLADGILKSSGLLSVASPAYVGQPYVQDEIAQFLDKKTADAVILVGKRPFEKTSLPDPIRNNLYIEFFKRGRKPGDFEEYFKVDDIVSKEVDTFYWDRIRDVAAELLRLAGAADAQPGNAPKPRATAFVSLAVGELTGERARLRQELINRNIRVVPEGVMPQEAAALEQIAKESAAMADFAVHLIGPNDPMPLDASGKTAELIQMTETGARCQQDKAFRRFIWPGEGRTLKIDKVYDGQDHVIARTISIFVDNVLKGLEQQVQKLRPVAPPAGAAPVQAPAATRLTIIYDDADGNALKPLRDAAVARKCRLRAETFASAKLKDILQSGDPLVLCWGATPKEVIEDCVEWAKAKPSARIALLRMAPIRPEQDLFADPTLAVDDTFTADPKALEQMLGKLLG